MTSPESSGPAAQLRRRLGISAGPVRRITLQNAAGERSVTEVAADGLSAMRGFPSGVRQWEWVSGQELSVAAQPGEQLTSHSSVQRLIFDGAGRLLQERTGERLTAEYHHDGAQLVSASRYEQISGCEMGWVESTFIPQPPQQGGAWREQVSTYFPDGILSVELREYDTLGREIYNESYSNADDVCYVSRATYRDDRWGNWVEMCIESHSNRPGSERAYVHRREIEYWEEEEK